MRTVSTRAMDAALHPCDSLILPWRSTRSLSCRRALSALLVAWCALAGVAYGLGAPNTPALVTRPVATSDLFVSVTGRGFGAGGPPSSLELSVVPVTGSSTIAIPSSDPRVRLWQDGQVVVQLSTATVVKVVSVKVLAPGVAPTAVPAETYTAEFFPNAVSGGLNAIATATSPRTRTQTLGKVFMNLEFHGALEYFDPHLDGSAPPGVYPLPNYPAPPFPMFRYQYGSKTFNTMMSTGGDHVVMDSAGRAYFNEYGDEAPNPFDNLENHSRILRYDARATGSAAWSVYNIPGDQNIVFAVGWDAGRKRIWAGVNGWLTPPHLVTFKPDSTILRTTNDREFRSPTTTCDTSVGQCTRLSFNRPCVRDADCRGAANVCDPALTVNDTRTNDCFLEIPLDFELAPGWMNTIAVRPDDHTVWFTSYFAGMEIIRYNPSAPAGQQFLRLPLAEPQGASPMLVPFAWPVDLKFTGASQLVGTKQFPNQLFYIDESTTIDERCTRLESINPGETCPTVHEVYLDGQPIPPGCRNPCVTELTVSGSFLPCTPSSPADPQCPWTNLSGSTGGVYFVAVSKDGKVWFDQAGRGVGYITLSDLAAGIPNFVMLPPAALYPAPPISCGGDNGNLGGIAIDVSDGAIWYGEYSRCRLVRHEKVS